LRAKIDEHPMSSLNQTGLARCERLLASADSLGVSLSTIGESRIVDCGIDARGGIEAGLALAEVCLAGRGRVAVTPADDGPRVTVATDEPLAACMQSQYAGWKIAQGDFFAMGSGPMRAAAGSEAIFQEIGGIEVVDDAIGVLETSAALTESVCRSVADACGVAASQLTLLVAPTASIAGSLQVVARSVETALHKLHELGFDLGRVVSGYGSAPLAPVAANDLAGIGRTNDAVLYGGDVLLWVRGDDASLREIGPLTPSKASRDYGEPFGDVFKSYNYDFYEVDPHLFSPAVVRFCNVDTGLYLAFGELRPDILARSFSS
jgi:methenyltetrahydromethanopterin cyclohydrolase